MKIEFTPEMLQEEVLRSKPITPSWYDADVSDIEVKPSNAGDSTNFTLKFKITVTDGGTSTKRTVMRVFSAKPTALGFWHDVLSACNGMTRESWLEHLKNQQAAGMEVDLAAEMMNCKGSQLKIYVGVREYEGKPQPDVQKFLPIDAKVSV